VDDPSNDPPLVENVQSLHSISVRVGLQVFDYWQTIDSAGFALRNAGKAFKQVKPREGWFSRGLLSFSTVLIIEDLGNLNVTAKCHKLMELGGFSDLTSDFAFIF
jgi:hypothetical protein